ncbi:hypothetical protein F4553_003789 [Allocatelliglobosispora scoriae]|uniref:Transposase n=1 Tax=Allocatelliglobosispora scoriae TaxID=643052 RepID=A0A841BUH5_9ACTN|nr:hypothetical protein [Allocatelliglobosispora scoriae]
MRVYCGLASADGGHTGQLGDGGWLTAAVVDDSGRLLDVCAIGDDAAGYATLGSLLAERSNGLSGVSVAADSDDHLVTMLLTAAGRPLAVADDDAANDFAERFADDESLDEIESEPAERRAVGLARALQAGALSATTGPAPRDLAGLKPVLTAHAALAHGRHATAVALREVLRELYPAALRAYPDPAEPIALAVLDALPEPGMLVAPSSARGARDTAGTADAVAAHLAAAGIVDHSGAVEAVTALRVAIAETPRRGGGASKHLTAAVAEAVRQAVAAVRACDAAAAALVSTLSERIAPPAAEPIKPSRQRTAAAPAPAQVVTPLRPVREPSPIPVSRRTRTPITPLVAPVPVAAAPVAPVPVNTPPLVHAQAAQVQSHPAAAPLPPGFEPTPAVGVPVLRAPIAPPQQPQVSVPVQRIPAERPAPTVAPADAGVPFVPSVTQAAMIHARAERRQEEPRPVNPLDEQGRGPGATEIVLPLSRPAPEPGDRANWPLVAEPDELAAVVREASTRVTPPWLADDLVLPEGPSLRLVDTPELRIDIREDDPLGDARTRPRARRTAVERIGAELAPPPVEDEGDGDLLIFATVRSAWFTGPVEPEKFDDGDEPTWNSLADSGWRAAEQASHPSIGDETGVGLPRRVPQANLVPGSPINADQDRPLRIVRDAERIAQHTSGYFRGWRRGQEVNGYAVGGRPGRESAGGWEFSRDTDDREEYRDDYRSAGNYGR